MTIQSEVQKLDADALVSLYTLDTTPVGGADIFRFTSMPELDHPVRHDGLEYTPVDIEVTGFRWDGRGAFPRPKAKIANVGGMITAAIVTYGDLVGSKFIRMRTFAKFLDDGENPDPTAMFPPEIFTVDQRTAQNKIYVEYEMASVLDQLGVQLPRRQCIKSVCSHRYRIWNPETAAFDYSQATCPYTGSSSFDESGNVVGASKDSCGRRLSDCKKRFGENGVLPTRAFPGIPRRG